MSRLKDKIIVVTGGKGLLGNIFIEYLKNEGAIAIALDINAADSLDVGELRCDTTNKEAIEEAITKIVAVYSRIDGWVNNAYPRTKDWGKQAFDIESMDSFATNVDLHLMGYVKCCQLVLNQMKLQGSGSLINMSSIYGVNGPDFTIYEGTSIINPSAYAAIKGGLISLTKYLAAFYGPSNVRVNCISPGGIFDHQPTAFVTNYEKKVPMRRMGTPSDIAPSVSFLLSDDARYITGHNLIVDGGWSII